MRGPADPATLRRVRLDRIALAITALGEDLSDWPYADLAQLHHMALELAASTNLALAEREEPVE